MLILSMVGQGLVDMFGQRSHCLLAFLAVQLVHFGDHIGDDFRVDAACFIQIAPDETRQVEEEHHAEQNEWHPLVVRTRRER